MDGHLRLDLKALGEHRKGLHKAIAESPEPRHDILDFTVKKTVDTGTHQRISHIVKGPLVLRKVGG